MGNEPGIPRTALRGWICLALVVVTALVYSRVAWCNFVNFDDPPYILDNPMVTGGLTAKSVYWDFTALEFANWHPLTWLSFQLDCQLFGVRPGPMHVVSLALHLANTVLLFLLLDRIAGALWPSALVAALFALHPLHVESVAWISERKDVLSTLFGLLAIGSYQRWVVGGVRSQKWMAVGWYALSLMAKSMLVTLPCLLLVLDFWPLGRMGRGHPTWRRLWYLLWEKRLFVVLAGVSSMLSIRAQLQGGAMEGLERLPLDARVANAALSYLMYVVKMIAPMGLACPYPHPFNVGRAEHRLWPFYLAAGLACVLFALACWAAIALRRTRPYVLFGWLWYVISLVPVIGIVQVGSQALADRYTYIPSIGLLVIFAWGAADVLRNKRWGPAVGGCSALVLLCGCSVATWLQIGYWQDSFTLFERALDVTRGNETAQTNLASAHHNLGNRLARQGDWAAAEVEYRLALRILPHWLQAMNHLGTVLGAQGKYAEANALFARIVDGNPEYAEAHYNYGLLLARQNRRADAAVQFEQALERKPTYAKADLSLSLLLAVEGKTQAAVEHYQRALQNDPALIEPPPSLRSMFADDRPLAEAGVRLAAAQQADPQNQALRALEGLVRSLRPTGAGATP